MEGRFYILANLSKVYNIVKISLKIISLTCSVKIERTGKQSKVLCTSCNVIVFWEEIFIEIFFLETFYRVNFSSTNTSLFFSKWFRVVALYTLILLQNSCLCQDSSTMQLCFIRFLPVKSFMISCSLCIDFSICRSSHSLK